MPNHQRLQHVPEISEVSSDGPNLLADERRQLLLMAIQHKDKEMLHDWIELNLGMNIPQQAVCDDHQAPFDFVADYLFNNFEDAIVVANRSGGKTMDFALLDTINAFLYDGLEIATVGAIENQAMRCYSYFQNFNQLYPFNENIASSTMKSTTTVGGSEVQVITGTMSGVNSPHPQLLFLDEVDLMIYQILLQALSMPQSKNGIQSRTVLTSTRKFAGGVMERLLKDAPEKGQRIYMWCIWEVIEKLPVHDPVMMQRIQETFGGSLPRYIDRADGYYTWQDTIKKYNGYKYDQDMWQNEWLCKQPGLKGVIYGSSFSDDNNVLIKDFSPKDRGGFIYLFEDFGYGEGHPDVVLFAWVPKEMDRIVIFDELYMTKLDTEDIWTMIENKLAEYELTMADVLGWVPDPHGLTEIADRETKGAPMMDKNEEAKLYIVNNGIPIVQRWLASGKLMITAKCVSLRVELLSYKRKKNLDGTYSLIPEKKNDHGPDALRYGLLVLDSLLAGHAFGIIEGNIVTDGPTGNQKPYTPTNVVEKPLTSGLLNTKL